ncbi:hypothetical protein HPB50_004616 [Hyalomma asiaticum]|uniref:Uncharacterized protein n=1 Tax=Hyalomma asiaticum TaxID=266040 RepID=A0ACB7SJR4_HYAAI|nr:hypothetical protein HPB50_004616 [Hyalomma asiaticum]
MRWQRTNAGNLTSGGEKGRPEPDRPLLLQLPGAAEPCAALGPMFLHTAMRYYRLWIYTCNVALLLSALAFSVAAAWVLSDYRASLVPGLRLADPTFVYAVPALLLQGGLLQALGCLGALRMNQRLLHAYWALLFALLLGDALAGLAWLFRYRALVAGLRAGLMDEFQDGYGLRPGYRLLWDRLQAEQRCCGVTGPEDYNATAWLREQRMAHPWMRHQVPASCCPAARAQATCLDRATGAYRTPCHEALLKWLQRSADLLCVLGFCVMAFLKLCFLGILRYEIREMIQKIRILSSDPSGSAEGPVESSRGSFGKGGGGDSALLLEKRVKPSNGNNNDASFDECHHKSSPV